MRAARLALGALDFLDRGLYIHDMEIHATLPGATSGCCPVLAVSSTSATTKTAVVNEGVTRGFGAVRFTIPS